MRGFGGFGGGAAMSFGGFGGSAMSSAPRRSAAGG